MMLTARRTSAFTNSPSQFSLLFQLQPTQTAATKQDILTVKRKFQILSKMENIAWGAKNRTH